jgi:hypothetical protein
MSRRRKVMAVREPNGRASRAGATELLPPTEIRRLFDAASAGLRDPMFGTMLGRIHLVGKITRAELAAGLRWAELIADYAVACQSPRAPRTAQFDSRGGTPADPDSEKGQREAKAMPMAIALRQDLWCRRARR